MDKDLSILLKECEEAKKDIADMRNYLHVHPELSGEEFETQKYIMDHLKLWGISYKVIENGGILAELDSGISGKTLLLRADVDALPVEETETNLKAPKVCRSAASGVSHACGHDAHTAMLLNTLHILSRHRDAFCGRILAVFERGEESAFGVKVILSYLIDHDISIDGCFAIHVYADLEEGKISAVPGYVMSGAFGFDAELTGRGGHSSRPDMCNNPTDCFVSIYNDLAAIRMRKTDPSECFTYAVGVLQGGEKSNVIPQSLHFSVLGRFFNEELTAKPFLEQALRVVELDSEIYECEHKYNWVMRPTPAVLNDRACAELAQRVWKESLGEEFVASAEPWMASESYSLYSMMYPSVLAFLGIKNEEKGTGAAHHTPEFDLDADLLYKGTEAEIAYALAFLSPDFEPEKRGDVKKIFEDYSDRF